ncbi:MAG: hypothetical protein OP8BY_2503 [Candidatus Saccharicenans subterraneus]|uniref:Uncharacterized protein n=1 Tax=Candidatus Saccharicenans subterraneus TaxID=2508984 RepID=A0A3E2BJ58_9BACT|nr:MAG: hypothetical protein OP8BY_2503 [Candidatus Saccharicenans subterraneum]
MLTIFDILFFQLAVLVRIIKKMVKKCFKIMSLSYFSFV